MKKDGQIAKLYRWTYGKSEEQMPRNFCSYFWKVVLATVVFPITWITYPWGFKVGLKDKWNDTYYDRTNKMALNFGEADFMLFKRLSLGFMLNFLLAAVAAIISIIMSNNTFTSFLMTTLMVIGGLLTFAIAAATVLGLTYGAIILKNKIKETSIVKEVTTIVSTKKDSFLNEYCPKIDWE